jgi:hypothetical protein
MARKRWHVPFYSSLPRWAKIAGNTLLLAYGAITWAGLPDDIRTWLGWFGVAMEALDGETLRQATLIFFCVLFLYLHVYPRLYFRFWIKKEYGFRWAFRKIDIRNEGEWAILHFQEDGDERVRITATNLLIYNDNPEPKMLELRVLAKHVGEDLGRPPWQMFKAASMQRTINFEGYELEPLRHPVTIPAHDYAKGYLQFPAAKLALARLASRSTGEEGLLTINCILEASLRGTVASRKFSLFALRMPANAIAMSLPDELE